MTSADTAKYQSALNIIEELADFMGEDSNYGQGWAHIAYRLIADCREYLDSEEV